MRKSVAPETSATSFEKSSSLSLIENVDMGELIEDLMRTKVTFPAYHRMHEFLTKDSATFSCYCGSPIFHENIEIRKYGNMDQSSILYLAKIRTIRIHSVN